MQFLKNDMDDMMRQAAAAYEPSVSGADWAQVEQKLNTEGPQEPGIVNNSRRYLLLFVFLLSSLVCNKYLFFQYGVYRASYTTPILQTNNQNHDVTAFKETANSLDKKEPMQQPFTGKEKNVSKHFFAFYKNAIEKNQQNTISPIKKVYDTKAFNELEYQQTRFFTASLQPKQKHSANVSFANNIFTKSNINIQEKVEPLTKENEKREKKLYGGIVAGIDASTVKFKQVQTGWQAGVVLGYQFSKKWAVESGLLWDKKSYYAEGEDFNTGKISLPSHAKILHADGYCNMFEIPLQVRYRFGQNDKRNWFVTAGASSYIMQKEEYDYLYERYNVQYYYNKYYKTSSKHFMATINLGAGYQHKIGMGTLRVEPYIKVPIQKMGIGSLPITSAGLQVGLTVPIR